MAKRSRARPTRLAVGYARRSTDRQEQSIADQRRAVELWAKEHGYELLDWYVDDAISGASADGRVAFQKMIEDARREGCPFSQVLVYDVKRFGRLDNDETGYYRYLLAQAGVEVMYVSENFSGDDTDDLLRPVKQWQARQELKDLSKVTIRGLLSRSEGGWWMGGTPPYGYDLAYYDRAGNFLTAVRFMQDGSKQVLGQGGAAQRTLQPGERLMVSKEDRARLVLSAPERVEVVSKIFGLYVHEGLGYKGIANQLNAEGVASPRNGRWGSGKWSMTTVREIVGNPTYSGDMTWNRRSMAKFHRIEGGRAVSAPKMRMKVVEENDEGDWIVSKGSHPAIIPRQQFDKAQARRRERRDFYKRNYRRGRGAISDYLLTGVIECARCGHHWQGYTQRRGRRRKDGSQVKTKYYACGGYVTKGNSVCRRCVIQKDVIEGMLLEEIGKNLLLFLEREGGRALLRGVLEELAGDDLGSQDEELGKLRSQRADIERRIGNILDNITAENREFADKRIRELKGELRGILPRIEELEAASCAAPDLDELTEALLGYMRCFQEVVSEGTVEEKRSFIRAFTNKIELDPETGKGRAQVLMLPDLTAATRYEPATAKSSFKVVAGARFVLNTRPHLERNHSIRYPELRSQCG